MNPDRITSGGASLYDAFMGPFERLTIFRWRRWLAGTPSPDSLILDLGAGTGANLPHVDVASRLVAVDRSLAMLSKARKRERTGKTMLVAADARRLPFRTGTFDGAIAAFVFCEIPEPDAGLAELVRTTKGAARIAFIEHVRPPGRFLGRLFDLLERISPSSEHVDRRTGEEVQRSGIEQVTRRLKMRGIIELIEGRAPSALRD